MKTNTNGKKQRRPLSKTAGILILSAVFSIFAAALVCVCVWGSRQKTLSEKYRAEAEKLKTAAGCIYEEAYTELVSSVYNIHIGLSKLLVSQTPAMITSTLNEIQRESGLCAGLMGQIPQSHAQNRELSSFLIRIGDYAGCLSKSVMRNKPICDTDSEQLISLYETSESIYTDLLYKLENNEFPKESITSEEFFLSDNESSTDGTAENADKTSENADEANEESNDTKETKKFPTLIYDGPFAESVEKLTPRGICGEKITSDEAMLKAKYFLKDENADLFLSSVSNGRIPSYDFEGQTTDGKSVDIGITVCGGHLLFMRKDASGDIEGLPSEIEKFELAQAGLKWLSSMDCKQMKPVAMQCYSGSAIISYAAVQNGVIIYNDLIKICIDRSTREIIGADARDYLFSHINREFPEDILPLKEVRFLLSPNLTVKRSRLALIPVTPQTEVLCYEFRCEMGNAVYAVYLDAQTGEEISILRIIKDGTGERAI